MARPSIAVGRRRGRQTGPGRPPGQALGVEPRSLIALESRRQDLGLPRSRRRLEAFERAQDRRQCVGSFEARLLGDMLPGEQEAQKIARCDRVDLRPQPTNGRMMDARQEAPVAPLLVVEAGKETPLENCAIAFESGEGRCYRAWLEPERRSERRRRHRPETLEPTAQDLDQGFIRRPCFAGLFGGRRDLRLEPRLGPNGMELSEPLGRNPQRRLAAP